MTGLSSSDPPASRSRTEISGYSDSLVARTQPAVPAPTINYYIFISNICVKKEKVFNNNKPREFTEEKNIIIALDVDISRIRNHMQ